MKIYVITKGEYSDYHICDVAIDKERAESLVKFHSSEYELAEIEEYDTEATPDEAIKNFEPIWYVHITPSGSISKTRISHFSNDPSYDNEYNLFNDNSFNAYIKTKSEEYAVKIALDRRAKILAERFGIS